MVVSHQAKSHTTEAECQEMFKQTADATSFWTDEFPVKRGPQ